VDDGNHTKYTEEPGNNDDISDILEDYSLADTEEQVNMKGNSTQGKSNGALPKTQDKMTMAEVTPEEV